MKKNICTLFLAVILSAALCLSATASQAVPATEANFAFLCAVSASGMESESLTAGVGDAITLHLYVNADETDHTAFTLQYDDAVFSLQTLDIVTSQEQCVLNSTGISAGSVSFLYQHVAAGARNGLVHMATMTFENRAEVSQTAYTFSLQSGETALCNPVTLKVDHCHIFSNWSTVSVSEDGKTQKQKRDCQQCDISETQTVANVDYSIALRDDAKRIKYNADEKILYAIAPGTTVGTLINSLTCVGNMQVVDKNGSGKSAGDLLVTGMKLLVMDEGDGMDANVQFTADISVWGDADCDGEVAAGDARVALRCSVGLENSLTQAQKYALDTDSNNNITAADARFLLRVSVNLDAFYAVAATSVVLSPSQLKMNVGEQKTLAALLFPTETTIRTIQWSTTNPAVASVVNGVVTATGKGTAVITATAASGASAICAVTVHQPVTSLTCTRNNFYLPEKSEIDLAAVMTIAPSSVTAADAVWQSSNAAFVVTNGKVTCNTAYGSLTNKTASITCTFPCGTKTVFNVTLIPSGATFCRFNYENVQVAQGSQFKLSGAISTGSTLKLVSDDTDVLTVGSDNIITAKGAGVATLTCTGVDYSEKVTVTVKSNSLRVVSVVVNSGGNDLAVTVKNTDTQALKQIDMKIAGYDNSGNVLLTKGCRISDLAAGKQSGYVWKDIWGEKAVVSAKITQITLTYADGHMETLPADCWHTGE